MVIDEFLEEVKKIENFYEKRLSDEQKQVWFQNLKNMDIKRFRYIEGQIYQTSKFMPKLANILEINKQLGFAKVEKQEVECPICKGTGYITYWKKQKNGDKEMSYEYMAVCKCGKEKKYEGWKISDERHRTNYYTPLMQELGL